MVKVLILAYDYPPYVSVGALRPYSWFKYLPEFGGFPVVVTRQWSNTYGSHLDYIAPSDSAQTVFEESETGIVIRTAYLPNASNKLMLKYGDSRFRALRKGISGFYEFGQFLLTIGPKANLYFEADKYLSENKVDLILATGEPYILFKYASDLSRKYDIPWIADYRDPWTQDKNRSRRGFSPKWDAFFEKRILSDVSAITTVSDFFQRQISALIPDKPIYIVSNGYDPEAVEKVEKIEQTDKKLSIGFVGTIHKWHPLESFLRVCSDFVRDFKPETPGFELNFYGIDAEKSIVELVETKYQNLKPLVKIHPKIPNRQLLEKLAANNVFLLFNYYSYMGTKIYDYLALKRQIILCYDDDDESKELKKRYYNMDEPDGENVHLQKQLIEETRSGIVVKDAAHLKNVLTDLYAEFAADGFVSCHSVNTEKYSRQIQVSRLMEIINKTLTVRQK